MRLILIKNVCVNETVYLPGSPGKTYRSKN